MAFRLNPLDGTELSLPMLGAIFNDDKPDIDLAAGTTSVSAVLASAPVLGTRFINPEFVN